MNYGQIRTQFLSILNRSDCTNALADTFISQGINRSQRILRTPLQEKLQETVITSGFSSLQVPNDLIETIAVSCNDLKVSYITPSRFGEIAQVYVGSPVYWTRIGSSIKFKPVPPAGDTIKLHYYGEFDSFTDDSTETALSVIGVDLLVYGGLTFAADYFIDERKDAFEQRWQNAVTELQDQAYGVEGSASIYPAYSFGDY